MPGFCLSKVSSLSYTMLNHAQYHERTKMKKPGKPSHHFAVIFDLDGVIVDNMGYHRKAWALFLKKHAPHIDLHHFSRHFGKTNRELLGMIFKGRMSSEEIRLLGNEKEEIYRRIYSPYVHPLPGLEPLLLSLKKENIPAAVASAAPKENVDFVLEKTGFDRFFDAVLDVSFSLRGKPDPGIYFETARLLKISPDRCLVFEDSLPGVQAALSAGMKVIGVTTTHSAESLKGSRMTIKDFTEIDLPSLRTLMADCRGIKKT